MPLPLGASYYTSVVKASSEANAAIGGAVSRGGNAVPPRAAGAVASIVKNNVITKRLEDVVRNSAPASTTIQPVVIVESRNTGGNDVFIVKYDNVGKPQWIRRMGADGGNADQGMAIASDRSGNVYVTGYYTGLLTIFDVDGVSAKFTLDTAVNSIDVFIAKYNTNGVPQWATRFRGNGDDQGMAITTDSDGNVYVAGFCGVVNTYQRTGEQGFNSFWSAGVQDAFVIKYDTNGAGIWGRRIGGTGIDQAFGIAVDSSGNVYATGYYTGTVDVFNAGDSSATSVFTLTNEGATDTFVVKYDSTGTFQWARRIGATGNDQGMDIAADAAGNTYVTGYYSSGAIIYGSDGTTQFWSFTNSGGNDAFIVKYNTSGVPQWGRRIGQVLTEQGRGITCDSSGNVYVTGYYTTQTVNVANTDGIGMFVGLPNQGAEDVFIVKYDTNGTPQWARRIGGAGTDQGLGITSDPSGNIYVTGYYTATAIIYAANNLSSFATMGATGGSNKEGFLVKYNGSGVPQWYSSVGGSGADQGMSISSDLSGNTYITGFYNGSITARGPGM